MTIEPIVVSQRVDKQIRQRFRFEGFVACRLQSCQSRGAPRSAANSPYRPAAKYPAITTPAATNARLATKAAIHWRRDICPSPRLQCSGDIAERTVFAEQSVAASQSRRAHIVAREARVMIPKAWCNTGWALRLEAQKTGDTLRGFRHSRRVSPSVPPIYSISSA